MGVKDMAGDDADDAADNTWLTTLSVRQLKTLLRIKGVEVDDKRQRRRGYAPPVLMERSELQRAVASHVAGGKREADALLRSVAGRLDVDGTLFRALWSPLDRFLASGVWWTLASAVWVVLLAALLVASAQAAPGWLGRYATTHALLERGIALSNVFAFASYFVQIPGLVGPRGLAPARALLARWRREGATGAPGGGGGADSLRARAARQWALFARHPTALLFVGGDGSVAALRGVCLAGAGAHAALLLGLLPACGGAAAAWGSLALWWVGGFAYLSLITVSGDFLGLQSDSNVPEISFLLGLVAPVAKQGGAYPHHACVAVLAVRFFAFRKMLACGVCKYRGSPMWRAFTAMRVHYFTQPLPSALSYFAHHLPAWAHRLSVVATLYVEAAAPFLLWGCFAAAPAWAPLVLRRLLDPWPRYAAWALFNGMNAMINLSGNYGFIGFLNTMENVACADDAVWDAALPAAWVWAAPAAAAAAVNGGVANGAPSQAPNGTWSWEAEPSAAAAAVTTDGGGDGGRGGPAWLAVRLLTWAALAVYATLSMLPLERSAKGAVPPFPEALRMEGGGRASDEVDEDDDEGGRDTLRVRAARRWNALFASRASLWAHLRALHRRQRAFRLVNYQGKFSGMHDYRWEPRIEGSDDGVEWKPYRFRFKPNDGATRPVTIPLAWPYCNPCHLPRLDWRIWFLPLYARRGRDPPRWFHTLLLALLEGRAEVLALLAQPAPTFARGESQPKFVRCALENFVFARRGGGGGGQWWTVRPVGRRTPLHVGYARDDDG